MALTQEQINAARQKYGISGTVSDGSYNKGSETDEERIARYRLMASGQPAPAVKAAQDSEKGFFGRVFEDVKKRGEGMMESVQAAKRGEQTGVEALYQIGGQIAGGASDILGEGVVSAAKGVSAITPDIIEKPIVGAVKEAGEAFLSSAAGQAGMQALQAGMQNYEKWKSENPRAARNLEATVNIASIVPELKGLQLAKGAIKPTLKATGEVLEKGVIKPIAGATEKLGATKAVREVSDLEQLISPKLTSKFQQELFAKGKIIKGKETFLGGKKPDIIEPSSRIKKAASIIKEEVPDFQKLDEYSLGGKINNLITIRAKALQPEMVKTPFPPSKFQKVKDIWQKVKSEQMKDPDFVNNAGAKRMQSNFETYLGKLKKPYYDPATRKIRTRNLNDLWDIRKEYDDSIKDTIKKATGQSDSWLQYQHDTWLQNRRILSDIIEKEADNLGIDARNSFKDMSALYDAFNNMKSKVKVDIKGETGAKDKFKKWAPRAVGAYAGTKAFEGITGINVPGL